ncbi:MAG: hypothetical protein SGJ21_02800 [Alphaproteobacteria bacterium]|nr:hypothetical protein [Alphaproteobacteria bacterium]
MFSKPTPKTAAALTNRIGAIAASPALEASVYCDASDRKDRAARAPAFKPASVVLPAGEVFKVVMKNVSANGARIEFFRKHTLSKRLYLTEPSLPLSTWAEVIWQWDGAAGIKFIAGPAVSTGE